MAVTVYLDTNIYDHIHKGIVPPDVAEQLRESVRRGDVELLLSVHDLEEAVAIVTRSPEEARQQLLLMRELASTSKFFREPKELIEGAIAAVVEEREPPDPFVPDGELSDGALQDLASAAPHAVQSLRDVEEATTEQIEGFQERMVEAKAKTEARFAEKGFKGQHLPFSVYFPGARRILARSFLERAIPQPSDDQIDRLLSMPYPRAYADAAASLLHSYNFEGRKPARGDSRDLMHAGIGGLVDVFVTHDRKLRRTLERIPERGYRVLNLSELGVGPLSRSRRDQ